MSNKKKNHNKRNKKGNSKIIIIIIVILLVVGLGFICYDKFINKEKPPVPTPTPNIPKNENEEWMEYLLDQNITSVSLVDDIKYEEHTVKDLREFFKEFKSYQYTVSKIYGESGDAITLKVEYTKNDKSYMIRFQSFDNDIFVLFDVMDMNDNELIDIIDRIPHDDVSSNGENSFLYKFTSNASELKYSIFENAFK